MPTASAIDFERSIMKQTPLGCAVRLRHCTRAASALVSRTPEDSNRQASSRETSLIDVSRRLSTPRGEIVQVGYFTPVGGSTIGSYWITDEIVYSIDITRGIDILRYTAGPTP